MSIQTIIIETEYQGERTDHFLTEAYENLSRSYIQKLIKDEKILVNGKPCKSGLPLKAGDEITLDIPDDCEPDIEAENIPLDIVYEDSDVIVVNKAKGMVVHPAPGHYSGTLVNALMYHCTDLSGINGILRPGIVHRIDRDTSGLIICAKNDFAHSSLAEQLKEHSITRVYKALCAGHFKEKEGIVRGNIGRSTKDRKKMAMVFPPKGKPAVTHYKVLEEFKNFSLVECRLETGRTHQIRVHLTSLSHPLIGDDVYGSKASEFSYKGNKISGQLLHAQTLGFIHPRTNEYMEFSAELPEEFNSVLEFLRSCN